MHLFFLITAVTGAIGLIYAAIAALIILRKDPGSKDMKGISDTIHKGAMAFLFREYRYIALFLFIVVLVMTFGLSGKTPGLGWKTAIAFLSGAFFSLMAGFIGMWLSTQANCRTTQAAKKSFNAALTIAFSGGFPVTAASLGRSREPAA